MVHRTGQTEKFVLKRLKNPSRLGRFRAEIEALTRLNHPNIIKIVDWELSSGDRPGVCFYVSEFCSKGDLSKVDVQSRPFLDKLRLFRQVCDAVAAAHAKNLLHRDLKPANILMRANGSLAVGDFGLCLDLNMVDERLTETTEAVGPRLYMAPELEGGRDEDPQANRDCYSLGKLLYFFVSGRHLVRERHYEADYNLLRPDCEQGLHFVYQLLDKSVHIDPRRRFPNAEEFLMELDRVIDGVERSAHVLDLNVKQRCVYCRSGIYQPRLLAVPAQPGGHNTAPFAFWGNNCMDGKDWMALVCDTCGNVQLFRPDLAMPDGWKNLS